jgi:hypothetical protein
MHKYMMQVDVEVCGDSFREAYTKFVLEMIKVDGSIVSMPTVCDVIEDDMLMAGDLQKTMNVVSAEFDTISSPLGRARRSMNWDKVT